MQLLGFTFGGPPSPATAKDKPNETKAYVVPEDRAIGRPHMMGWLDLLGDDEELTLARAGERLGWRGTPDARSKRLKRSLEAKERLRKQKIISNFHR